MAASPDTFAEAFSPETFRAQGHAVVDLLADHLARAQTPGAVPVLPSTPPDANLAAWTRDFGVAAPEGLMVLLQRMLDGATHVHSPRYVGHQVAAPLPAAALCHALVALTNNSTAVYEMSPVATVAEHAVVRWMAEALGYPASGRSESRDVYCTSDLSCLGDSIAEWDKLRSIVLVCSTRTTGDREQMESRLYISSLPANASQNISHAVRSHWSIENKLHWTLDVC